MSRRPDYRLRKAEVHLVMAEALHKECRFLARLGRTRGWTLGRVVESMLFEEELVFRNASRRRYAQELARTQALRVMAADATHALRRTDAHLCLDRRALRHLDELRRLFPGLLGGRSAAASLVIEHGLSRYVALGTPSQRLCSERHLLDVLEEVHARAMRGEL